MRQARKLSLGGCGEEICVVGCQYLQRLERMFWLEGTDKIAEGSDLRMNERDDGVVVKGRGRVTSVREKRDFF